MTTGQFIKYLLRLIFLPRTLKTMEWKMLRLLNKDRKRNDLPPLLMQGDLRRVARKHSQDMAREDYFSHVNLKAETPRERLKGARVTEVISGENLAKIGGFRNPVKQAEIGLMNSPGHRTNILNKNYNCVGIGAIKSERKIYYFTQNFTWRNLIFETLIPQKVKLKKGLHLKGRVLPPINRILYQVKTGQCLTAQDLIFAQNQKFDFKIKFKEPAFFQIQIYCAPPKTQKFSLVNQFEIKVKKGWF